MDSGEASAEPRFVNGCPIGPNAKLRGANLRGADLRGANLQEADLQNADLKEADLRGADLQEADLTDANLMKANLQGTNLRNATLLRADLQHANLQFGKLPGADLRDATLRDAVMDEVDLEEADLQRAALDRADLSGANLRRANLERASLKGAKLCWAVMEGAQLEDASFEGADVEGADLSDVGLGDVYSLSLAGLDLRGVKNLTLDGQDIVGTRFSARAQIPWLILRRRYTSVMTAFHLLLAASALAPYLLRALWTYLPGTDNAYPRIAILTGWDVGWWTFVSSTILIVYNLARIGFTWWLSQLADQQDQSGHAPEKRDYWPFWLIHQRGMRWIELCALGLGVWRTGRWLIETP